jgi:pyruvate formate lyase activating enzyme
MRDGQRGFCFVRANQGGQLWLKTYGRSSGFCIDPIEKKPLNHVAPGTAVLSFGTAGCNLACKFCQNWELSTAQEWDLLQDAATPEQIADTALKLGCRGVAYTYNDPVIFAEYAIDIARAVHDRGLLNIAVSAGYINAEPRKDFFQGSSNDHPVMDAANIDLKGFTEDFYRKITGGHLGAVKDTLRYLVTETRTWVEITTLLIPGHNDSDHELHALTAWIASELGPHVPLHFTAFHPDYRMLDTPPTPLATLERARRIGLEEGLQFVYTGNLPDPAGHATRCPNCDALLIQRTGYDITDYRLTPNGRCPVCGTRIPGLWDAQQGYFNGRRIRVNVG